MRKGGLEYLITTPKLEERDRENKICRDKMRRFAEILHIELLVYVERYGNVVYYGEKIFHLS